MMRLDPNHWENHMCLSTVYVRTPEELREVMQDVARVESEGRGVWLIDLFGKKKFIEGTVRSIDLVDAHQVVLDPVHDDT
jgi:predicted RNA-binding protein